MSSHFHPHPHPRIVLSCTLCTHSNVIFPYISDVIALTRNGSVVQGVSDGALALAVSSGTTFCVVAAPGPTPATPVFLGNVSVHLKHDEVVVPCPPNATESNATRVCVTVPPLQLLCGNDSQCISRGEARVCVTVCRRAWALVSFFLSVSGGGGTF